MKSKYFFLVSLLAAVVLTMAFRLNDQDPKPWPVPDNYKTMKNPVKFNKTTAMSLYSTHCKSCHGKDGLGDGPKAAQLKTSSGDFSSPEFQKQSDGSLFYKTLEGRDEMPSFKKKLPDEEEIWQLVHYMRTFAE